MRLRQFFYFMFFIALIAHANLVKKKSIIPAVKIKKLKVNNLSLTSGPAIIISDQQLEKAGVTSLSQALQHLGGVQLHDMAGNASQVLLSLRGFGANASSNTLLLVNGIPITNPDLAPPDLNSIPLNEIAHIEIISGSESVLYGDQAVGGLINIVMRQKPKQKAELSCAAGSYQTNHCYAALHQHTAYFDYNMTLSNQQTDNYREHNRYYQQFLLGHFLFPYATGHVNFSYQLANEDMQYPGALTSLQVRQDRRQASNEIDFFKSWHSFFQVQQQQELAANWQLQTDLVRRDTHGHGVLSAPFTQSRVAYYFTPTVKAVLGKTIFTSGLDLQKDHYHLTSVFGSTDNHQEKQGIFFLVNAPIYQALSLSFGARGAQQIGQFVSSTAPASTHSVNRAIATTLGFSWPINTSTHGYLRQAGSFRFPKADEISASINRLRTQRGIAYESGIEINKEKYAGQFAVYQLNLTDEIAFDPIQTPELPFGSNRNLAPTTRRGFSVSGKAEVTGRLQLDGQYNLVDAKFQSGTNTGKRIPLVAENIIRGGLDYGIAANWHLYTEALYTGNQYSDSDDANATGKIGGYTIYNLNLNYQCKNVTASLRLNNIFNKYYYLYTVYQSSMAAEFFYPAADRNFMLTLAWKM